MDDGECQYEWEAGRRLKKMIVKDDPAEGIEDGFDERSATTLKLEFSNGNLLTNGVADTVITAKVYRKGDYDLMDAYYVGVQTSLGVSWGFDLAHITQTYTIVTRLNSRNYSLLGRSKNRYTVRSSVSKFRVEMDR